MAQMTTDQIRDVLTRVLEQPNFRQDLMSNPAATLAAIQIACDPGDIPALISLPDDDEIQSSLDDLTEEVVVGESHIHVLLQLGD